VKFQQWFKLQFGKRPSRQPIERLRKKARDAANAANLAEQLYRQCERWDQDSNTALYGWNASENRGGK
jgi:hypothetical protein